MLQDGLVILAELHRHRAIHGDLQPGDWVRSQMDQQLKLTQIQEIWNSKLNPKLSKTLRSLTPDPNLYQDPASTTGRWTPTRDLYALGGIVIQSETGQDLQTLARSPKGELNWHLQATHLSPQFNGAPRQTHGVKSKTDASSRV